MGEKVVKPLLKEVAASRDVYLWDGYVGEIRGTPDPVLESIGGDLALYRGLLRDHQVKAVWQQRVQAMTAAEWVVEPGGDAAVDKEAADWLRDTLNGLRWDAVCAKMAHAQFFGFAVAELIYERDGGRIALADIRVRRQERFGFDRDGTLRLRRHLADWKGEPVPPAKFWVVKADGDNDDDPHGVGLGHHLWWPVFLKRNGARFWAIALEKFGMPTVLGHHPPGSPDSDVQALLSSLMAVHGSTAIALPEGFKAELLEAVRSSGGDHERWMRYWDGAIAKIVAGQTMTTDDGSSLAQAKVHQDTGDAIVKADADLLHQSFNVGPVRWLCGWNYPTAAPPRVWRQLEAEEDLTQRAQREAAVARMSGLRPTARHVAEVYGGEWEAQPAPVPPALGQTPAADAPAEFAEAPRDAVDDLVDQVETLAASVMDGLVAKVRALVFASDLESLDHLPARLLQLAPNLPTDQLAEILGQAMILAHLDGAAEAADA
ncbi:DUF935 domain-containing protein [Caenispirillum bisanense]|uniref:Mu-like prophage protein gp29 n=1 Tax=Caenispirillum bisanense TaxID=414052 RepID=A0A286GZY7_9PROT|nr:DUF935 family protein [Caenispirillum bisanense]SOE00659.1 Mu-like prophage protein gp29 [Caenispirillum bisanense]